jgi:hypothetical protein
LNVNRIVGTVVCVAWLVAMTALVRRDVLPFWDAQEAPARLSPGEAFQVAIHNEAGSRIGTTWITTTPTTDLMTVHSTTVLDLRLIDGLGPLGMRLLCDTCLTYLADDSLDRFRLRVVGVGVPIEVVGERCGREFACTTTFGRAKSTLVMDGRLSECLAEKLRPFTALKDLKVGQRWRIRLLDPVSLLRGQGPDFSMRLATVTGRETINHAGRDVSCFRIETEGTVAWADETGRVLRQEVRLPVLGRWIMTDERFDRSARQAAEEASRHGWDSVTAVPRSEP